MVTWKYRTIRENEQQEAYNPKSHLLIYPPLEYDAPAPSVEELLQTPHNFLMKKASQQHDQESFVQLQHS